MPVRGGHVGAHGGRRAKMIDYVYENNFLDSSRETDKVAILNRRQTRGISIKSLEIYAVFDVKKRASLLITLSD